MERGMVVTALLAVFVIVAIVPRFVQKLNRIETVGCIGINRRIFMLGKLSLFASLAFVPVQAFSVNLSLFGKNSILFWICVALLGIGILLFTLAIMKLGTFSLRVGLAQQETALRTTGIYRVSRNPMLLGLYLMALGSAVYVQNPLNWILAAIALTVHHKIILAEEAALRERFGVRWVEYCKRVRRYV